MTIESGPSTERIVRNGLFFLMIVGFGVAFLYDGYTGYESANFAEHIQSLDTAEREKAASAPVYPSVTIKNVEEAAKAVSKITPASQREHLVQLYGGPPSYETADAIWYFGPDYRVKFPLSGNRLLQPIGTITKYKNTDIRLQRLIGWALAGAAVVVGLFMTSVVLTHCRLADDGLSYRFKGRATWDEMKSLETTRFLKKGWVELVCHGTGGERRIRLDEYHLKRFPEIVAEICRRKGFEDPVAKEKAMKAKQAEAE